MSKGLAGASKFYYSHNGGGEHPQRHLAGYTGILQADTYAGFADLYDAKRCPGPMGSTSPYEGTVNLRSAD